MADHEEPNWLTDKEQDAWLTIWAIMEWLPVRLGEQMQAESGISLAEYNALSQISMVPNATIRLSELAELANMKLPHLSRVMTRLEKAEWVIRFPDPTNGRYTLAQLTEAGKQKVAEAAPGHVAAVRRYVFDHLSPKQVEAMVKMNSPIVDAIGAPELNR